MLSQERLSAITCEVISLAKDNDNILQYIILPDNTNSLGTI